MRPADRLAAPWWITAGHIGAVVAWCGAAALGGVEVARWWLGL